MARIAESTLDRRGDGRDGFGHRGDPDDRIRRHGRVCPECAPTKSTFVHDALIRSRHRDDTGDIVCLHRLA